MSGGTATVEPHPDDVRDLCTRLLARGPVPAADLLEQAPRQLEAVHRTLLPKINRAAVPAARRTQFDTVYKKRERLPAGIRTAKSPGARLVHIRLLAQHVVFLTEEAMTQGQFREEGT
jgi:hypothetical protein